MQNLLLTSIPMEQLKSEISETVKKELQILLLSLQPAKVPLEYLTRKEAANFLSVSLPTLNDWTKTGKVKGYRIASRVRYKRAELENSLSAIHTKRRV
jgi:excisionase family DNA binding protein